MSFGDGGEIRSYRDLMVWQKAMDAAEQVYELAERFPRREVFGMWAQVTRAAASIPANVAEGHARGTPKEFAHSLSIAKGSAAETETFLLLAVRRGYLAREEVVSTLALLDEISRMLATLRKRILGG